MRGSKWVWVLVQLMLLLVASLADAEPAEAAPSVDVVVAGDRTTTLALQARLLPWLEARDVRLAWSFRGSIEPREVLAQQTPERSVLARIWVDARSAHRAILYVVDGRGDRFLVRVLPVPGRYDEVTRESLGNVVESAMEALLHGGEIGIERELATREVERELGTLDDPVPAASPTPTPPKSPAPAPALADTSPGAGGGTAGDSSLLDAVTLGASLDTLNGRDGRRVAPQASAYVFGAAPSVLAAFGWLGAGYSLPSTWSASAAGVELHGPSVRMLGGLRGRSAGATWRAAAGVGLELLHVEPHAFGNGARPVQAFWIASPLLSARVAFEPYLGDRWFFSFALGADVDLAGHHFDIDQGGTRSTVLEPWRVRPVALVALGFSVTRGPFFSARLQP